MTPGGRRAIERAVIGLAIVLAASLRAGAQGLSSEVDVTVGGSTEGLSATAAQIRLFGPVKDGWRLYLEAAYGRVSTSGSDAFGAAYPYDRQVRLMETFVERLFRPGGTHVFAIKGGRYRAPFGIYGRSDHAYSGFVRAPLIRYGSNWALSNTFLEAGVDVLAGRPSLSIEASVGAPVEVGAYSRRKGVDAVVRGQAYVRSLIVGASYLRTQPNMDPSFARGRMEFGGVDARWMRGGVQMRGEWIGGRPFNGVSTYGGYVDLLVHVEPMGPVTAVARVEYLDYNAGPFSAYPRRVTAGARVRLSRFFTLQTDLLHQPKGLLDGRTVAADIGLTGSIRF